MHDLLQRRPPAVVALGARVAGALAACVRSWLPAPFASAMVDYDGEDPFSPGWVQRVAYLPHPSGRCRAWNEPGARERARALVAGLVRR